MKANRNRVWLQKDNTSLILIFVLCVVLLSASVGFAQRQEVPGRMEEEIIPEHYIVVLRDHVVHPLSVARSIAVRHGFALGHVYQTALKGFSARIPGALLERVWRDPDVAYIEPDRRVYAVAQTVPTGVRRMGTESNPWAKIDGNDGDDDRVDVDIAILDTGIDLAHPDLNVFNSTNCARSFGGCLDGQGIDGHGHGTHVAGIAAALDNGEGVVGVAPGARLWAVKVLNNSGSGYLSWIIQGIDWVTAHADSIEVASMSLAWVGYSSSAHTAIKNSVGRGIVYFAAAGNDSRDIYGADGFGTGDDICPAAFPEVAAVSALHDTNGEPGGTPGTEDDSFAWFSNFSNSVVGNNPVTSPGKAIDLMCPGVDIYSTYKNGRYATFSGTSMASPHAAGLAALYIAEKGERAHDAGGVKAIRQALIDRGAAQNSPLGLAIEDDPDNFPEPLGWAGTLEDVTDIAITEISAPSSVVKGAKVSISVEVRNVGTVDVTSVILVTLVDETKGAPIGDGETIHGLGRGASGEVSFEWDTSGTTIGEKYVLTAHLTNIDDTNEANNHMDTTVTVTDELSSPYIYVADLDGKSKNYPFKLWMATVTITVQDNLDQPVETARISGVFSDGPTVFQCTTNAAGTCSVQGWQIWENCLTFTVMDISATLEYWPEYNTDPDGDSDGTSITVCR
jgi:subtilisin family serine protease